MQASPCAESITGASGKHQHREFPMPTPLQILMDPVSLAVLGIYAGLILLEALFPARPLPRIRGWRTRALVVFTVYFFLSSYLPLIWGEALAGFQFFTLESFHPLVGAVVGVLFFEFLVYVWHRAMHKSHWLWRSFHQMHHSAERMDIFGAFYFSPLDIAGFAFLSSLALTLVGLPAQAVTWYLYATMFLASFQHTNIRTPQWLGYIVQRPESHSVHHGRGIHHYNFSDLPLFDILFGTFRNPKDFVAESGFEGASSAQIAQMLDREWPEHDPHHTQAGEGHFCWPLTRPAGAAVCPDSAHG
jgi:sterol desaturase/sphingolipid hydroxylase (fatty acid hydroxylase superfamily)